VIKYLIMKIKLLGTRLRALRESEYIYGVHNPLTYDFLHHNLHHLHVLLFHSADQQDFTRGPILRQLLVFMLPILLSQLLQRFSSEEECKALEARTRAYFREECGATAAILSDILPSE